MPPYFDLRDIAQFTQKPGMNPIKNIQNNLNDWGYKRKIQSLSNDKKIILSSTPRGGSTWAYEILLGKTGIGVWEPLHPVWLERFAEQKNGHHDLFAPKEMEIPNLQAYLDRVIHKGILHKENRFHQVRDHSLTHIRSSTHVVYKFCRLGPLLPWFLHRFPLRVWHIIRDPFSVVSSQLRHPAWSFVFSQKSYRKNHNSYNPPFYERYHSITDKLVYPEEFLTAKWCLDLIPLLSLDKTPNLYISDYESLVKDGEKNFLSAYNFFKLQYDNDLPQSISKPSMTTLRGSNVLKGKNPALSYKNHLRSNQISRIQGVLESFDLDQWKNKFINKNPHL